MEDIILLKRKGGWKRGQYDVHVQMKIANGKGRAL